MFSLTVVADWFKPAILTFIHKQKQNKEFSCQCSGNSARLTSAVTPIDGSPIPLIKVLSTTDLSNSLTPTGVKTVPSTLKGASENKCVSRPPEQPDLNNKAVLDSVTLIKIVTNIWGPPQDRSHYHHLHNAQEHPQESVDIHLGTKFLINTHVPGSFESRGFAGGGGNSVGKGRASSVLLTGYEETWCENDRHIYFCRTDSCWTRSRQSLFKFPIIITQLL